MNSHSQAMYLTAASADHTSGAPVVATPRITELLSQDIHLEQITQAYKSVCIISMVINRIFEYNRME